MVGDANVTATGPPLCDVNAWLAGQAIVNAEPGGADVAGGVVTGGVGPVGSDGEHATTANNAAQRAATRVDQNRRMKGSLLSYYAEAQLAGNSKQPGVARMVPCRVNDRLPGTRAPVAKNCTVRAFSPSASYT